MRFEITLAALSALLLAAALQAQDRMPIVQPFRSYVVSDQSLTPPSDAKTSSGRAEKWSPRERRHRGETTDEAAFYPAQLVCSLPGALEPQGARIGFFFALEDQLGLRYEPGSFAFSGRSDSFFWQPQMGWGSENVNQDFLPLLMRRDYEDLQEPSYEFLWQHTTDIPFQGDSIYLNYMFKIPKESRTLGHAELRTKRQSFERGFSTDAPKVEGGRVLIWNAGSLYAYDSSLASREPLGSWDRGLPDLKATSFAFDPGMSAAVFATADLNISAFGPDAALKWTVPGRGPVTALGGFVYSMLPDYSGLQATRLSDGKTQTVCPLPKSLPRTPNSFFAAKLSGRKFLGLVVPWQSKMLFFEIL